MDGGRRTWGFAGVGVRSGGTVRYSEFDQLDLGPLDRGPGGDALVWRTAREEMLRVDSPIDRWRLTVAMTIQQLAPLVAALALWGALGQETHRPWAGEALVLAAALAACGGVLLLSAILLAVLGAFAGVWRPGNGR